MKSVPFSSERAFEGLAVPVVLLDRAGRVVSANRAMHDLAREGGWGRLEPGVGFDDLVDGSLRQIYVEDLARALRGETVIGEHPVRRPGLSASFETRLAPVHDDDGGVVGASLAVLRLNDPDTALEALARSERRFRLALQHAADGVTIVGVDGTILYISEAVRRIFQRTPEEMVDTNGFDYIHPDDLPRAVDLFERSLSEPGGAQTASVRMSRSDGSYAHMELISSSFVDDPAVGGLVVNARDVTERHLLEQRLRFADRMASLGTLAAGVAHEINNPLTFVIANLDLCRRDLDRGTADPETLEASLAQAREGAERVRRIVRDLKTFSRGDEDERPRVLDLASVVDSALTLAGTQIRHRARLVRDLRAAPRVRADETRLGQAVLTLLVNAAEAIPEGDAADHEVRVSISEADDQAVVRICDSGVGIPAADLPRIFDPFFTTKDVGVGTGLGLSICHGIVTTAGGCIDVTSRPGRTCFTVRLPLTEARPDRPSELDGGVRTGPRRRILVIDDEPLAGRSLGTLLAPHHDVEVLTRGRDGLERLVADDGFDVVLCDLIMPDLSGMELHAALAEQAPRYSERVVFITGGAFTSRARAFVEQVPNPVLEKPLTEAALLDAVRRVTSAT